MKFVLAKDVEKPKIEILIVEEKDIGQNQRQKGIHCLRIKGDLK